jgi:hypothetical protein
MMRTTTDIRIFFRIDGDTVTVLDVAKTPAILTSGGVSNSGAVGRRGMASVLETIVFDPAVFREELDAFDALLKSKADLAERADIQPFFKANKHLTAYIGTLYLNIAVATEICFEFDLAGDFRADILLGSKKANQFCVVEFEPGEQDAIFKKRADRKNPEWSARFEHAFSQIVDWFYSFEDQKNTAAFQNTLAPERSRFRACSLWVARAAWTIHKCAVWHGGQRRY